MTPNLLLFPDDNGDSSFFRAVQHYAFFALAGVIENSYSASVGETNRVFVSRPERRRMTGHMRHSMIEEESRNLAGRVEGVEATSQPYQRGSGSFSLLRIQDALVTFSCVKDVNTVPREAKFRAALRRLNQWNLVESVQGDGPRQHIMVIHGPVKKDWSQAEFIWAVRPDPSGNFYTATYDLRQHPGALSLPTPTPAAPIIPAAGTSHNVTLKRRAKTENEE